MLKSVVTVLSFVAISWFTGSAQAVFIAYNDFAANKGSLDAANVTNIGNGATGSTFTDSGILLNQADGASTGVTMALTLNGGGLGTFGNGATNIGTTIPNDATTVFGLPASPIINMTHGAIGNLNWNNPATTIVFTGLTAGTKYDVVLFANRNNATYNYDRQTQVTIQGVSSFSNVSSASIGTIGADKDITISTLSLANDTTSVTTGYNPNGLVVHFADIVPTAASGTSFTLTLFGKGSGNNGYIQALRLESVVVPEPATLALLGLGGLALLKRQRKP